MRPNGFRTFVPTAVMAQAAVAEGLPPQEAAVVGTAGDDILVGTSGSDTLEGLDGNDRLEGGLGDDSLYGGAGADLFVFSSVIGVDVIYDFQLGVDRIGIQGGATYTIQPAGEDVRIFFSNGNTILILGVTAAQLTPEHIVPLATSGNDTFTGTSGDDVFDGLGGNDTLRGLDGNDVLSGGDGVDYVEGGAGDDVMDGGSTPTNQGVVRDHVDYQNAAAGVTVDLGLTTAQDTIGAGIDTISNFERLGGSAFADVLTGGAVAEAIFGRAGADTIYGGGGDDVLSGGSTEASTLADSDVDILFGGDGGDRLYGYLGDQFDGGAGVDYLNLGGTITQTVNIDMAANAAGAAYTVGTTAFVNFEAIRLTVSGANSRIIGGGFEDNINAQGANSWIEGGGGDDVLLANGTIMGGDGDDRLSGSGTFEGGAGNDTIFTGGAGADMVIYRVGDGRDLIERINYSQGDRVVVYGFLDFTYVPPTYELDSGIVRFDGYHSIEFSSQSGGDPAVIVLAAPDYQEGTAGDDSLSGSANSDDMYGLGGADILNGGLGEDRIGGGQGDDTIIGGTQDDQLTGGAGHDLFVVNAGDGRDIIFDFAPGGTEDQLVINGYAAFTLQQFDADLRITFDAANYITLKNVSISQFGASDINLPFDETAIYGTAASETINGTAGPDTIYGYDGNDVLNGLDSDDVLLGAGGGDALTGGAGADRLEGGAGVDSYYFTFGDGHDTLIDTSPDLSFIYLSGYASIDAVQSGSDLTLVFDGQNSLALGSIPQPRLRIIMDGVEVRLGGIGADTLTGDSAANYFIGGAGDDVLSGQGGADRLFGGAGDDLLSGGAGGDLLDGGDGFDTVDFQGGTVVTINLPNGPHYGAAGGDSFVSIERYLLSSANDRFTGSALNETVEGNAGDDQLNGGDGDDRLSGGAGNDILTGGNGVDTADYSAATAAVTVSLATAAAQATGGAGTDTLATIENLLGSAYGDSLTGSGVANRLEGGAGADTLSGAGGDDALVGGLGDDTLDGGAGNDLFLFAAGDGHDVINGFTAGGTEDRIEVTGFTTATKVQEGANLRLVFDANNSILLTNVLASAFTSADINIALANGATQTGTAGNDTLIGTANADLIDGLGGNDTLTGGLGDDELRGGDGDDTLRGGLGSDIVDGGAGSDTVSFASLGTPVRINLVTNVHVNSEAAGDTFVSIENFILGNAGDNFVGLDAGERVEGLAGNDVLNGLGGNDTLNGGDGDDTLNAGDGDDRATGGAGNDRIDGGLGTDVLTGSTGDDYLHGRDGNDTLDGGAGADTLIGGSGTDVVTYRLATAGVSINLLTGVNTGDAAGDTFNSIEYFQLSNHNDSIVGSAASDIIRGMAGDDVLDGGDRHDGLNGGDGNDTLLGGAGRDTLHGEKGNDTLTGGADYDQFWFSTLAFGNDTVTDFQDSLDEIRITGISGVDDFGDLVVTDNGAGGTLITFPDGSTVTLEGTAVGQIEASDFVWI